jgi:hypothetical protein
MIDVKQYEKANYAFAFDNIARTLNGNREALDAFRAEMKGITLKEAMTSDELSGYIPQLFVDEVIILGQRQATARNAFPVIAQSSNSDFKIRFREKNEGAQVLRELDEFQHSKSQRYTRTFEFNKIGDFPLFSFELLEDSPLDEVADEVRMSVSKIYRRDSQLAWDMVTRFSQGTENDFWGNHVLGPACIDGSSGNDAEQAQEVLDAMEAAYLDITTRLEDAFPQESLRWFLSPQVWALLWKDSTIRRYDALGSTPVQVTGNRPQLFGIPATIIEPGYFDTNSVWTPQLCDIYLMADQAFRLRERVSMRTQPITMDKIQASGPLMWERLTFYPRNPLAYRRISPNEDYAGQIASNASIKIVAQSDV